MNQPIEKFTERNKKALGGAKIEVFAENKLAGTSDQLVRFCFNQENEKYSIFSVIVELTVYTPRGYAFAIMQTDFNIYPYADLSSFGIINTEKFSEMMEAARQNCLGFVKHYCEEYGYDLNIFPKQNAKVIASEIKPISN